MQNSYDMPMADIPPALAGMLDTGYLPAPSGVGVNQQVVGQGDTLSPQMLETQVNQFIAQNPQQVEEIRNAILQVLQTGELTQQELNMIVQLATVAAQNPEMYPHVRKFAIQNGIATEQDLPVQYDQGLVFVLLIAARAVQADWVPSPVEGGAAPGEAHEEYVIPANVVKMKGREFFDSLVEKYK